MLEARGFTRAPVRRMDGKRRRRAEPALAREGPRLVGGRLGLGYLLKALALERPQRDLSQPRHRPGPLPGRDRRPAPDQPADLGLQPGPRRPPGRRHKAIGRIGRWRHIASANGDPCSGLGELFDGHIQLACERTLAPGAREPDHPRHRAQQAAERRQVHRHRAELRRRALVGRRHARLPPRRPNRPRRRRGAACR
jgi:hypothetical protein